MDRQLSAQKPPPDWLDAFLSNGQQRRFSAGATIIRGAAPSESLFYLIDGSVTVIIQDEDGRELVLAYLNRGEFFGEMGLFDRPQGQGCRSRTEKAQRSARVVARSVCRVAEVDYARFMEMSEHVPDILFELARQMSQRLRRTSAKVRDLAFLDAAGRIARCLLDLSEQPDAMTHPEGMQVRITRREIARIVGCSREMVGRVLKELKEQGLVRAHGKTVVVLGRGPERPAPLG